MKSHNVFALLALAVGLAAPAAGQKYTVTDLGGGVDPDPRLHFARPAINNLGQVVFNSDRGAFLWTDGKAIPLPMIAYAINDSGQVVGAYGTRAVLWGDGKIIDIGTGLSSWATGINNTGQVVGSALIETRTYRYFVGFLWRDGQRSLVGRIPESIYCRGINGPGQVIGDGFYYDEKSSYTFRFRWSEGFFTDLGALYPYAINDLGQVVGSTPP